jgi:presenilin-like A22 family membrane protease
VTNLWGQELTPEQQAEVVLSFARQLIARNEIRLAVPVLQKLADYFPETPAARKALALRDSLVGLPPPTLDQSGRVGVVVFSTLYGTWLGAAIPIIAKADDPKAFVAGMMAGSITGLLVSLNATKDRAISDGRTSLINFGGWFGTWQGIAWANAAGIDEGRDVVTGAVIGGLTGLATSILLTKDKEIRPGYATLVNFGGIWGSWFALCTAMIFDVEQDETAWGMVGAGGDVGIVATAVAARHTQMSRGRARLINIAGVVGTVFGLGIAVLAEVDDAQAVFAIMGTGSVAGLLIGSAATKNYDRAFHFDDKQRFGFLGLPHAHLLTESRWTPPIRMVKMPVVSVNF